MKKGITLIGEIVAFLFLIIFAYFLGFVLIYLHWLGVGTGGSQYTLDVESALIPVRHEAMLMALLETTFVPDGVNNIPMKTSVPSMLDIPFLRYIIGAPLRVVFIRKHFHDDFLV